MSEKDNIKDSWEDRFREKLKHYDEPLTVPVWDSIQKEYRKRKLTLMLRRIVASVAAIVIMAMISIWLTNTNNMTEQGPSILTKNTIQIDSTVVMTENLPTINTDAQQKLSRTNSKNSEEELIVSNKFYKSMSANELIQSEEFKNEPDIKDETLKTENMQADNNSNSVEAESVMFQRSSNENASFDKKVSDKSNLMPRISNKGNWDIGLYASNGLGGANLQSEKFYGQGYTLLGAINSRAEGEVGGLGAVATRHKLPLSVGLSFRYEFLPRWSVETGLSYNMLKSDIDMYGNNGIMLGSGNQTLHYIGLPLKLNFDVWKISNFGVYVSAGAMMQKMVAGNQECEIWSPEEETLNWDRKVDINNLQWSVGLSAGVGYNFLQHLGVYVEPGVNYYFDNGSSVDTYYNEHEFGFTLKFGLRYKY